MEHKSTSLLFFWHFFAGQGGSFGKTLGEMENFSLGCIILSWIACTLSFGITFHCAKSPQLSSQNPKLARFLFFKNPYIYLF
ncbi:hypothetical protein COU37_05025 [Candidatus Micrarchaeota archaeon CG10_big_fil_rev_8_21_14_0_10_45_29]|nr:MAG: hypothetical protein COU37_05025 [Candidatus Micrarchaeota archaeon CG10_big_fil_rev_8_21_14_0_10_45_29]